MLAGSGNTVAGSKNIMFGNNNKVFGDRNYVFSQNFDSTRFGNAISDNLVLDNWLLYLRNIDYIPYDARYAITKI